MARLYTITPSGISSFSATLCLRYLESEVGSLTESQLRLWRYNGSAWEDKGGTPDTNNNYVEASGITGFSPWAIGGPSAPTAVTLMEFAAAHKSGDGVGVRWRTGLFVMTTCLNGYFPDPTQTSLGEAVLLNATGGAFAVVASSGLNASPPQYAFNLALYQSLFGQGLTLGEAVTAARQAAGNKDVRNCFVLLGDPTMKLK